MRVRYAIQNQYKGSGHLGEMLGKVRLAHHAAGFSLNSGVYYRHHALMAPGHQCVEFCLCTGQHGYALISAQFAKRLHALVLAICLHMERRNAARLSADQALNGVVTKYSISHRSLPLLPRWRFFTRAALSARGLAGLGPFCRPT